MANATTACWCRQLYLDHHGWLHGWLRRRLDCTDTAADLAHDTFLRLLGAFPLHDTDRVLAALAALEATLPVRVQYLAPWWVRVVPR